MLLPLRLSFPILALGTGSTCVLELGQIRDDDEQLVRQDLYGLVLFVWLSDPNVGTTLPNNGKACAVARDCIWIV